MRTTNRKPGSLENWIRYYRKSRDIQEASIERQHSLVDPWTEAKPWNIIANIEDEDVSGSVLMEREGIQKIMQLVRAGQVDGIACDDWDRLLRVDAIEMGEFIGPLRRAGVVIESVAQGRFDYNTMTGRLMMSITSEAKHGEIVATARRALSENLRRARDLGDLPLSKTVYGYRRMEDTSKPTDKRGKRPGFWVIDEDKAVIVRQIFKWFVEGKPVGWIVKELLRRAVPSSSGRAMWGTTTIRRMLENDAYLGARCYGKKAKGKFFRIENSEIVQVSKDQPAEARPRDQWMFSEENHPPIIDRDLFAEAQKRREREKAGEVCDGHGRIVRRTGGSTGPSGDPSKYILSKLLVCGRCEGWMSGTPRKTGDGCKQYVCVKYIQAGSLGCVRCPVQEEPMIKRLLGEIEDVLSPKRQQVVRAMLRERLKRDAKGDDLDALQKEARSVAKQLDSLRQRLGEVSRDMISEIEEVIRRCRIRQAEIGEEIKRVEESDPLRDLDAALDEASREMWKLRQAVEDDDRLTLRETLHGIVSHVVIQPDEVSDPRWGSRFVPGGFEVVLRKGTGLALLSSLDISSGGSVGARTITFSVSA